ncbi:recombinase family protein [Lachnospiraceae bacterium]|nr:recombinase family protein [Lachnospiraceae bacterium]
MDAVSRLARNVKDLMVVVDDLKELGIGILIVKGGYWTYNMGYMDIMMLSIEGGLAQAESMQTSERVKSHMGELAKKQLLGGDMFGYRLKKEVDRSKNTLVQEPTEAYVVRLVFEKYCSDDPDEALTSSSLCQYLIRNRHFNFEHDLNWTPSKVIRILNNTKYMGDQLPGKSEVVDTVRKKKVLTHKEPVRNRYDGEGRLIEGNLVKGNWEPIVSEDLWWKAYDRKKGRSRKGSEETRGLKSGRKVSGDAYARKMFCSCGYALSRQYVHVAKDGREAQYRYKCRWQIMKMSKYTQEATHLMGGVICENPAVSEMKVWLGGTCLSTCLRMAGLPS